MFIYSLIHLHIGSTFLFPLSVVFKFVCFVERKGRGRKEKRSPLHTRSYSALIVYLRPFFFRFTFIRARRQSIYCVMSAEKVLTEKLVREKTKVSKLEEVQRLDLWGEGLTDISFVAKLPHLKVLSLAANNVSSLKPLRKCTSLQELYLRKNKVTRLREVTALSGMPKLTVLWMMDNPCSQHEYYRDFVLHCCQALQQLDSVEITAEERKTSAKRLTAKVLDEILERKPTAASTLIGYKTHSSGGTTLQDCDNASVSSMRESNAANEEGTTNGQAVLFTTTAAQRAMLLSIVSLLPELTVESLELLQREVQERKEKQKKKVTKLSQESPK